MSESVTQKAEQFESLEHQHHTATLGMWVFLTSELMLFGAMFLGYTVYRIFYGGTFAHMSRMLMLPWGTMETTLLLSSSFTMSLATHSAKTARMKLARVYLLATLFLGTIFLFFKGFEWYQEYTDHLVPFPWLPFDYTGTDIGAAKIFMSFYYVLTGFHLLHLTIGVIVVIALTTSVFQGKVTAQNPNRIEMVGMYWHTIDIVWTFIFPVFYLALR